MISLVPHSLCLVFLRHMSRSDQKFFDRYEKPIGEKASQAVGAWANTAAKEGWLRLATRNLVCTESQVSLVVCYRYKLSHSIKIGLIHMLVSDSGDFCDA